jgi:hypothetical protein
MQVASFSKKVAGAAVALALCTSSTGAIAASTPHASQSTISPLVALSALGSDVSRAALCGASQGCVLPASYQLAYQDAVPPPPVADPNAPPPPVEEALPPPPVAPPPVAPMGGGGSFGISPLLLALAGITAAVLLALLLKGGNNDDDEESPA